MLFTHSPNHCKWEKLSTSPLKHKPTNKYLIKRDAIQLALYQYQNNDDGGDVRRWAHLCLYYVYLIVFYWTTHKKSPNRYDNNIIVNVLLSTSSNKTIVSIGVSDVWNHIDFCNGVVESALLLIWEVGKRKRPKWNNNNRNGKKHRIHMLNKTTWSRRRARLHTRTHKWSC